MNKRETIEDERVLFFKELEEVAAGFISLTKKKELITQSELEKENYLLLKEDKQLQIKSLMDKFDKDIVEGDNPISYLMHPMTPLYKVKDLLFFLPTGVHQYIDPIGSEPLFIFGSGITKGEKHPSLVRSGIAHFSIHLKPYEFDDTFPQDSPLSSLRDIGTRHASTGEWNPSEPPFRSAYYFNNLMSAKLHRHYQDKSTTLLEWWIKAALDSPKIKTLINSNIAVGFEDFDYIGDSPFSHSDYNDITDEYVGEILSDVIVIPILENDFDLVY